MSSGVAVYIVNIVLQFINRVIFLKFLSVDYLGINGLFSNVLSMLNIAELGIAGAMVYALYKPISDNNINELKSIMFLYKKLYRIVGFLVLGIGICLIPFLNYFINVDEVGNIAYLKVYFLLYVLDSGISYFLSYKRSIIICDQQSYIINGTNLIRIIFTNIFQIAVLILTQNYMCYLLVKVICTFGENVFIHFIANKKYPFLKEKTELPSKDITEKIKKNILAMSMHKIGYIVIFGTDNIIITKFVSLAATGLYSNYTLIINSITSLITQLFSGLTASVGNLLVEERENKEQYIYNIYRNILFVNFCIYYVISIGIYMCIQNLIVLWIGDNYLLSREVVFCAVLSFFSLGMRKTISLFKDAGGLFWNDRYKPLIESVSNLLLSIPLTMKFGIAGTLIGTIITNLFISGTIEAYITYKYLFKRNVFRYFAIEGLFYTITILSLLICGYMSEIISGNGIVEFIMRGGIAVFSSVTVIIILFGRSAEFNYIKGMAKKILR